MEGLEKFLNPPGMARFLEGKGNKKSCRAQVMVLETILGLNRHNK